MKYEIIGEPMPVVVCHLDNGESMITEKGSMCWMSPNLEMQTAAGGVGKAFGRMFSGDAMFQNRYTARGGNGMIAFAASFPGSIRAIPITPDRPVVAQKSAFLASEEGVELSVFFQKKGGAGFFGGEGFIMQKLSGRGMAFAEVDGELVEYHLEAGQQMVVDTGNVLAYEEGVLMEVHQVPGLKNKLLGGEGIFNTTLTGPGSIWLQTMPISSVAGALLPFLPKGNA